MDLLFVLHSANIASLPEFLDVERKPTEFAFKIKK